MNGMEKLIMVMRKEGSRNNPAPLVFGEMSAKGKCIIRGMEFGAGELYIAEHLTDHEETVTPEGEGAKRKIAVHSSLREGDTVLCYRIADDKYVIIEKVVGR